MGSHRMQETCILRTVSEIWWVFSETLWKCEKKGGEQGKMKGVRKIKEHEKGEEEKKYKEKS